MTAPLDAIPADGTDLQWKAGGASFVTLGRVEEISSIEMSVMSIKKTYLGSTQHEKRPSKIGDPGKLSGKIQFNPDDPNLATLYSRIATPGVVDQFQIIFDDGMTVPASGAFSGFFTKWKVGDIKVEAIVTAEFEIEITSFIVITPGSAS